MKKILTKIMIALTLVFCLNVVSLSTVSPQTAYADPYNYTPYPGHCYEYAVPLMHDGNVVKIQQELVYWNIDPGPVDGYFGSRTEAAVRWFQTIHALPVDGIVGPITWDAIVNDIFYN